jgi:hypothetical protein
LISEYARRVFEGEAPCDKCDQAQSCQDNEWACRAFSYFVLHGTFVDYTVRMPTRELFHKIFKEDDKALKNYLRSIQAKKDQKALFD